MAKRKRRPKLHPSVLQQKLEAVEQRISDSEAQERQIVGFQYQLPHLAADPALMREAMARLPFGLMHPLPSLVKQELLEVVQELGPEFLKSPGVVHHRLAQLPVYMDAAMPEGERWKNGREYADIHREFLSWQRWPLIELRGRLQKRLAELLPKPELSEFQQMKRDRDRRLRVLRELHPRCSYNELLAIAEKDDVIKRLGVTPTRDMIIEAVGKQLNRSGGRGKKSSK
jgi:hypothetical protein